MLRFLVPCGFAVAPLLAAGEWTRQPAFPLSPGMAGLVAGTHNGRGQAVAASLDGAFYLSSGLETTVEGSGRSRSTYLNDAYRYRGDAWERLPDPPWSAVAAPSPAPVARAPARVAVLGGVDGRLVGRVPRDTRAPDHVLICDVKDHRWRIAADRWREPVVTAPAVAVGGEWWIVSGEIMPGVRTTSVNSWRFETP